MRIIHVVGARPNFMKAKPVIGALERHAIFEQILVHTGQHYDANMSKVFFQELGLPSPDVNLEVGSGSHAVQTAEIMKRFETVLLTENPDWVLVYGDVNSTIAAALVSAKLDVPVAHVEAGLRSFDRSMPEEINRVLTDQIATLLFTPSADADENLLREGVVPEKIRLVGNVMIDTLVQLLPAADARWPCLRERLDLGDYGLVTLHRPSNVDDPEALAAIMATLSTVSTKLPLVFPVHPRTQERIMASRIAFGSDQLQMIAPVGYLDFLALQQHARVVITDSGGVQEETTYLQVPCLTVRANTERPVTIRKGTNSLVGQDMDLLRHKVEEILTGEKIRNDTPPLWDGHAGERIADELYRLGNET